MERLEKVNQNISNFSTLIGMSEIRSANHYSGLTDGGETSLLSEFRSAMDEHKKNMKVYANAKAYESYQKMLTQLIEQIDRQNDQVEMQTRTTALSAGFIEIGGKFVKKSGSNSFMIAVDPYARFNGKAALDKELGPNLKSAGEIIEMLKTKDDVEIEAFFYTQRLMTQAAFERIVGRSSAAERKTDKSEDTIGKLGVWIGGTSDSDKQKAIEAGMGGSYASVQGVSRTLAMNALSGGFGELGASGIRPGGAPMGFYVQLQVFGAELAQQEAKGLMQNNGAFVNSFAGGALSYQMGMAYYNARVQTEVYGESKGKVYNAAAIQVGKAATKAAAAYAAIAISGGLGTAVGIGMLAAAETINDNGTFSMNSQKAMGLGIGALGIAGFSALSTVGGIASAGFKWDENGHQVGGWGFKGGEGEIALGGALMSAVAGELSSQAGVSGTFTGKLFESTLSGMYFNAVQYQKFAAGHNNNLQGMMTAGDLSGLGSLLGSLAGQGLVSLQEKPSIGEVQGLGGNSKDVGHSNNLLGNILGGFVRLRDELETVGGWIGDGAKATWSGISTVAGWIGDGAKATWNGLKTVGGWIGDGASWLGNRFMEGAEAAALGNQSLPEMDRGAGTAAIMSGLKTVGGWIGDGASWLGNRFMEGAEAAALGNQSLPEMDKGAGTAAIMSGISTVAGWIGDGASWLGNKTWSGISTVAGWIGDGVEWTFQKLLDGGRKVSDTIAGWVDDYKTYRVNKEMEAMHTELRDKLNSIDEIAARNEAIADKLKTEEGYNQIAERLFIELKKKHPELTDDQIRNIIPEKINDLRSALMNNIAADDVYLNYGADKINALTRFERMIHTAAIDASQHSMDAFGIDRMSDAELTALGFNPEAFDTKSGMQAWLYRVNGTSSQPTQFILGFRGTEGDGDVWADVVNAAGIPTAQYKEAARLALEARDRLAGKGELSFTGHSLGGGLASLAAAVTGGNAVTFNAAGVPSMVVSALKGSTENIDSRIKAYYLNGDGLSAVQDIPVYSLIWSPLATPFKLLANWLQLNPAIMPAYLPSAMGERIEITGVSNGKVRDSFASRFSEWGELHRNTNMQRSLQREFR